METEFSRKSIGTRIQPQEKIKVRNKPLEKPLSVRQNSKQGAENHSVVVPPISNNNIIIKNIKVLQKGEVLVGGPSKTPKLKKRDMVSQQQEESTSKSNSDDSSILPDTSKKVRSDLKSLVS